MADLELIVDSKDVVNAQSETTKLERNLKRLFDRYSKGAVTNGVYEKSLKQITQEYKKLGVSSQKATGQVRKYVRDLQKEKTATEQSRRAKEEAKEAQIRLNEETRKANEAAKEAARQERERAADLKATSKAMDQHEAEMESLRLKYDQTYRIQKQYEAGLEEIRMAHMAGALSAEQMEKEIESLGLEFQKMQRGQKTWSNQFVKGSTAAGKSANQLGVVTQQAGYQIGDFLVQVQSGTNAFVAFGQQATQLVGVLPMLGGSLGISAAKLIAISSGLGIAIPLITAIGAAWVRTSAKNDKASDATKRLKDNLDRLNRTVEDWVDTKKAAEAGVTVEQLFGIKDIDNTKSKIDDLKKGIEQYKELMKKAFDPNSGLGNPGSFKIKIASMEKELSALQDTLSKKQETLDKDRQKNLEEINKTLDEQRKKLEDSLELKKAELKFGEDSVEVTKIRNQQEVDNLKTKLEQDAAAKGTLDKARETINAIIELKKQNQRVESSMKSSADEAERLRTASEGAATALASLNDVGSNISKALAVTTAKIDALKKGADETIAGRVAGYREDSRKAKKDAISKGVDPLVAGASDAINQSQADKLEEALNTLKKQQDNKRHNAPSSGSGSGDSGVKSFIDMFIGDEDTFQAKREKLDEWLQSTMDRYSDFNAAELEILKQHNIDKLSIEEDYQQRLAKIDQAQRSQRLNDAGSFMGSMANVLQQGGGKMVKVASVFSAAQGLINSYTAYTEMLKDPSFIGRPWARFAAAASVLAAGLRMVQSIKAVGSGGKGSASTGGGAGGGGNIATPANTNASPQKVYIEGLDADSLISGRMLSEIFDKFYKENEERGAVFMVKGA